MKVLFCIFSGTGNTLRVGEEIAARLRDKGAETEIFKVRSDGTAPPMSDVDLLVIGYPVHAFNAPTAVLRFIKNLPRGDKKAYLLHTSGEALRLNDASGITPRRLLTKKGYRVVGELSYVMPYNIIFRHSDEMAARMWQCALRRADRDVNDIIGERGKVPKVNAFKRAVAFTLRIEHPAMPIVGRRFRADERKCVGCGTCVSVCPMSNISLVDGKPRFGRSCVGCMACAFSCPSDAVRTSLFNGWRVNGAYSFSGEPATDEEVCKYCRKSYLRYFHESEEL